MSSETVGVTLEGIRSLHGDLISYVDGEVRLEYKGRRTDSESWVFVIHITWLG